MFKNRLDVGIDTDHHLCAEYSDAINIDIKSLAALDVTNGQKALRNRASQDLSALGHAGCRILKHMGIS